MTKRLSFSSYSHNERKAKPKSAVLFVTKTESEVKTLAYVRHHALDFVGLWTSMYFV